MSWKCVAVILMALGVANQARASAAEDAFQGTWKLLSVSSWIDGKEDNPAVFGKSPTGYIHYLPGRRMAAVIAYDNRKAIQGDRIKASTEARARAYATFLAYAGRTGGGE